MLCGCICHARVQQARLGMILLYGGDRGTVLTGSMLVLGSGQDTGCANNRDAALYRVQSALVTSAAVGIPRCVWPHGRTSQGTVQKTALLCTYGPGGGGTCVLGLGEGGLNMTCRDMQTALQTGWLVWCGVALLPVVYVSPCPPTLAD
jgi:hypothetical protein